MKVISFVTQKGGAGKTTLATSLAVVAEEAGEKVAILDMDPQKSLSAWAEARKSETPAVDTVDSTMADKLNVIVPALADRGYTLIVLDTAGIDSTGTHLAIAASDLCVIPSRPTTMDIRATKATYEVAVRLNKKFIFILNQCPPQPNNPRAYEASIGLKIWGVLALPMLMQRAAHQDAFASSLGVTEYDNDSKAAHEIRQLWDCLKNNLWEVENGKKTKLIG